MGSILIPRAFNHRRPGLAYSSLPLHVPGLSRIDTEALLQKYDANSDHVLDVTEFSRLVADLRALANARANAPSFPARLTPDKFPRPGALPAPPSQRDVQINVAASAAAAAKAAAAAAASAATTAALISECEAGTDKTHKAMADRATAALAGLKKAADAVRAADRFSTLADVHPEGGDEPSLVQSLEAMQAAVKSVTAPAIAAAEEAAGSAAALFETLGAGGDGRVQVSRLHGALESLAAVADVGDLLQALSRFDRSDELTLHQYADLTREIKVAREIRARASSVACGGMGQTGTSSGSTRNAQHDQGTGDLVYRKGASSHCGRGGGEAGVGRVEPARRSVRVAPGGSAEWHSTSGGASGVSLPVSEEAMWEDLRTTKRLLRQMAREPGGPLERAGAFHTSGGDAVSCSHALQAAARLEELHPDGAFAEFGMESWCLEDSKKNRPLLADIASLLFEWPHAAVRIHATQPSSSASNASLAKSFRLWFPREHLDTQATVAQGRTVSCRRVLLNSGIEPERIR